MAQKVATARKMKSRQETTSLGQIATVTAKPTISDKHLQTRSGDVLKFRRATWDPHCQGLVERVYCLAGKQSCLRRKQNTKILFLLGIWNTVELILTAISLQRPLFGGQSIHWLLFKPLYKGHFRLSPKVAVVCCQGCCAHYCINQPNIL